MLDDAEHLAANQGTAVDMRLAVGPVPDLAHAVATIIIDDAEENPKWIAKWQARPRVMAEPARCLLTRDDVQPRLGEITCPALVVHGTEDTAIHDGRRRGDGRGPRRLQRRGQGRRRPRGHLTNPEPVNTAILDFLAGLPA